MNESTPFPHAQEFHLSLRVADLAKSTAFYGAILGVGPKDTTARYSTFIVPHLNLRAHFPDSANRVRFSNLTKPAARV